MPRPKRAGRFPPDVTFACVDHDNPRTTAATTAYNVTLFVKHFNKALLLEAIEQMLDALEHRPRHDLLRPMLEDALTLVEMCT